jgi:hypothetical protein
MAGVIGNFKSGTTLGFNKLRVFLRGRNSLNANREMLRISGSALVKKRNAG